MQMQNKSLAYFYIILAASLWGGIGLFFRILTAAGLSSIQAVSVRVGFSVVLYALFLFVTDRNALKINPRHCWYFIGTGIFSLLLFNWSYFNAIDLSNMATAAVLLYTAPIFVTLMSAVLFREPLTPIKLLSLGLTFFGCTLVTGMIGNAKSVSLPAILFGITSGFGYALYTIFGRYALRHYRPSTVTLYTFLFGTIGVLPLARPWEAASLFVRPDVLLGGLGMSVLCCILPYVFYTEGLTRIEASKASILATLEPVVAAIIGAVAFHEILNPLNLLGIALVVFSAFLLNRKSS